MAKRMVLQRFLIASATFIGISGAVLAQSPEEYRSSGDYARCGQQALLDAGFDPSGVDGAPGGGARRALLAWGEANGVAVPTFDRSTAAQVCYLLTASAPRYADLQTLAIRTYPGAAFGNYSGYEGGKFDDLGIEATVRLDGSTPRQVSALDFGDGFTFYLNGRPQRDPYRISGTILTHGQDDARTTTRYYAVRNIPNVLSLIQPVKVNDMATRVDFKHVRQHASFEAVLAHYGIELHKDGTKPGQFKALCPFHEDTKPSLKINTEKNVFHCFVCGAGGNILEFVRDMDGTDIRTAALKVAEICGIAHPPGGKPASPSKRATAKGHSSPAPPPSQETETPADADADGDPYNRELTFSLQLGRDDDLLSWLTSRGINADVIDTFGLGRASNRSKTIGDRLAIPIHNRDGELVAYCGRYVGDDMPDDAPKYILPKGFRKDLEVFNLHRAIERIDEHRTLLVFESYFSVMRHHEEAPCVSFLGRSVSDQQVELMADAVRDAGIKKVVVIGDGDQPGREGARSIAGLLSPHVWTRVLDLADGEKPHRLVWEELYDRIRSNWQKKFGSFGFQILGRGFTAPFCFQKANREGGSSLTRSARVSGERRTRRGICPLPKQGKGEAVVTPDHRTFPPSCRLPFEFDFFPSRQATEKIEMKMSGPDPERSVQTGQGYRVARRPGKPSKARSPVGR